jgi:N-acetyl sugar amidotransferase
MINQIKTIGESMPISRPYQICTKLVIDTSDPDVTFDSDGVSNHYHAFKNLVEPIWETNINGRLRLEQAVEEIKKGGRGREFDCLIGLSGGIDSSYMLHQMVTEFNLRPLVFHVDAGWNSEIAVHNIQCIIEKLKLDLYTEVINWNEVRDFQLSMFKSGLPNIDLPQDIAFIGVLYKYAAKHGIKTILNGGNIASESVSYPLKYYYFADLKMTKAILKKYGTVKMQTYPFTSSFYRKIYMPYVRGVKMVKPLNYIPYVKDAAMQELTKTYGWKSYPQKHFESRFTRFLESYWLPKRFGYDVRRVQFSSLILSGQMTRDEALSQLEKLPYDPDTIYQEFNYIANKMEISEIELNKYLNMSRKFYWDYPNNSRYFDIGEKILSKLTGTKRGGAY